MFSDIRCCECWNPVTGHEPLIRMDSDERDTVSDEGFEHRPASDPGWRICAGSNMEQEKLRNGKCARCTLRIAQWC